MDDVIISFGQYSSRQLDQFTMNTVFHRTQLQSIYLDYYRYAAMNIANMLPFVYLFIAHLSRWLMSDIEANEHNYWKKSKKET